MQELVIKIILAPFSLLYGSLVGLRNAAYRLGFLKSVQFDVPTISVGNLSTGGTGKTPHTEYLVRLLKDYINVGTLSRGYGRKTEGFLIVQAHLTAQQAGDEPLQLKRKNPDVMVAVGESRAFAIPRMLMQQPDLQTIILDDAFQHRAITPALNILLSDQNHLFTDDYLLPSGRLREWRAAYRRADIVIVTKCPANFSVGEKEKISAKIKPYLHQKLYFSYFDYGTPYYLFAPQHTFSLGEKVEILLLSGIAKTDYLKKYLQKQAKTVHTLEYADHHFFEQQEMEDLKTNFERLKNEAKEKTVVIVTTEKDATRLGAHRDFLLQHRLPIFVLPIQVAFHFGEGAIFDQQIKDFLVQFR